MIKPIIDSLNENNLPEIERRIASLSLFICDGIESGFLSPKIGDDCFSLLDLYIDDNYPTLKIRKEIQDIIYEGMILHDYGNDYGSNLHLMKLLAQRVLGG
ncbi:MAG: hypothetical protein AB2L22_11515 [Syntrophales bacterium]